jgi:RNA polymerase sigma-B factor
MTHVDHSHPPPVAVPDRRGTYDHMAPLFVEHDRLPSGHPRRTVLRSTLIEGHLPVAQNIARRYRRRSDSDDDIEQVATLGLILAVDRYEPARGTDFLSFAVPTINGEVLRHFRDRTTAIHDAAAEFGQAHGRSARTDEIAVLLGVDVSEVVESLQAQAIVHCSSLDEPTRGETTPRERTRFGAALAHTEPAFDLVEHREALAPLVAELPERERRILLLRFFGGLTQSEIGHELGISQMHVSRLLTRTLSRLRRKLNAAESATSRRGRAVACRGQPLAPDVVRPKLRSTPP